MKQPIKIVEQPWGKELWYAQAPGYVGKILTINKGCRLSLQFHNVKHETIYILKGKLLLELNGRTHLQGPGRATMIPQKAVHRFSAPHGRVTLLEISTPEVEDVVRSRTTTEETPANRHSP